MGDSGRRLPLPPDFFKVYDERKDEGRDEKVVCGDVRVPNECGGHGGGGVGDANRWLRADGQPGGGRRGVREHVFGARQCGTAGGEPAAIFPVAEARGTAAADRRCAGLHGRASQGGAGREAWCGPGGGAGFVHGPAEPRGGGGARRKGCQCVTLDGGNVSRCEAIEDGRGACDGVRFDHAGVQ